MNAINNNHTKLPPTHPGEILNEEFLIPMRISKYRLAKAIGVDATRIHSIVNGERSITAETALLFSRFFGNSTEFWMRLQQRYDREIAEDQMAERLAAIIPWQSSAES
ncbi:MAG: HigA family addiction module antidote protein [Chloroflexi bacterium]|nr:HigA family addiction module antidote protein [Chloroflexota bacterium]